MDAIGPKKILQLKSVLRWNWFLAFFLMEFSAIRENGKSKSWNKYLSLSLWMSERMFINNSISKASCHWGGSRAEWVGNFYNQTWLATFERACIILSSFFLCHGDALKRLELKQKTNNCSSSVLSQFLFWYLMPVFALVDDIFPSAPEVYFCQTYCHLCCHH